MTALIITVVVVLVLLAGVAWVVRSRNRQANIARSDELRAAAAGTAQATIAPAQQRAAVAEERAEEAREVADRAEAEAERARIEASRVEAEHEAHVRAADRLDPRVDHRSDDYQPQVAGTVDQQPTPPSEADVAPAAPAQPAAPAAADDEPADQPADGSTPPLLPRRTPGANDMPGKPIAPTDGGGGWFTRKDPPADGS